MNFWLLFLHILGACVWVGGHIYLAVAVLPKAIREHSSQRILDFEASFERLGMSALIIQVITGLKMAGLLLPQWSMITNHQNPIAVLLTLKLTWLALTIVTALSAQLWIIPKVKKDLMNAKFRSIFIAHILMIVTLAIAFVVTGTLFRTGF
ncbi:MULTISPECIES: hypothetical protein [unclassified Moraxella]|uniref:hypothetical protein n=1 Tax=unclassified Moraxella TaxID=2685852 RepID=UPI003AF5D0FC